MVGLIICLVLLSAALVYSVWTLAQTRNQLETSRAETKAEHQALVDYKDKCYCKEIV